MRIGITCHPSTGGSGILATELGIALAERGHEIHFVTYEAPYRLSAYHENIHEHYTELPTYPQFRYPPNTMALATKIADVAEEYDIQLWHAHYAIPYAMCAHMARMMLPEEKRFRLVTTLHGTDITLVGIDPSFFRITKFVMDSSCAVTAVSDWLNRETQREFNLAKPVHTIYNFLNQKRNGRGGECIDRGRLAEPDECIVMHVSNFRPVKRVTDVVRAFKKIADKIPAKLVMVGEGPERMSALGVARQLGIADRVVMLGNYRHIESLIEHADLVFQPSEHESFGLVAMEAMAAEVPVLGTDSGGVREVVDHGATGYLTEVGDIDRMAEYALKILTDPAKASSMGKKGREAVINRFDRDRIVDQYEALYSDCEAAMTVTAPK
jgi:N-acetyl-alpha-D-glucosaminyl L-malate synthase BshA